MGNDDARRPLARLERWLLTDAYPVWSQAGWDARHGGFHERLAANGPLAGDARRVRVQLRQIYSFARAPRFGWTGDARGLVIRGLDHFFARYRRPDGLARALVAADGTILDDRALLYDQAFVLLALAEACRLLGPGRGLRATAEGVLERIYATYGREGGGFRSEGASERPLSSNPQMHLLESALAWCALSDDPRWRRLADELVELALERLIDARSGVLREHFELEGTGHPPIDGRIVEPGHQFEWAWLLLCAGGERQRRAARRLIEIGETHGVRDGVAINSLLDDMTVHDPRARLWPQTERLKAHALMARLTGEPRHWQLAAQAAEALERYLDAGAPGLWHDQRLPDGSFVREPAPASSFYHIVCGIGELAAALEAAPP
jgi:mannose/cellobiose epimerase-like protein (N-acyl-D-glucosamine 2-epimerase family)